MTQTSFYEIPIVSLRIVRDNGVMVKRENIRSPMDAAAILQERMKDLDREVFTVVHLDTRNNILSIYDAFIGTINSNHIRVADIFKVAIISNAAAILVAHNHPSGDPTPSPEDVSLTKTLKAAADILDVQLLDHLVIGADRFVSMREHGLGDLE